jgi:hypothetical protein
MNPENASVLGYILLLIGVALSIIGYVIYLNIRGDRAEKGSEDSETASIVEDEVPDEVSSDPDAEAMLNTESSEGRGDMDMSDLQETPEEDLENLKERQETTAPEVDAPKPTIRSSQEPELIQAAILYREGVTGRIVVQVGDRQYTELEELRNSKDWSRIKSLASDLSDWVEERSGQRGIQETIGEAGPGVSSEAALSASDSMIVQINEIINQKVITIEGEERDIQLVEGLIGEVEVRVGLEKFPIDEVPYDDVRELIQEAVTQWESSQ